MRALKKFGQLGPDPQGKAVVCLTCALVCRRRDESRADRRCKSWNLHRSIIADGAASAASMMITRNCRSSARTIVEWIVSVRRCCGLLVFSSPKTSVKQRLTSSGLRVGLLRVDQAETTEDVVHDLVTVGVLNIGTRRRSHGCWWQRSWMCRCVEEEEEKHAEQVACQDKQVGVKEAMTTCGGTKARPKEGAETGVDRRSCTQSPVDFRC